LQGGEGAGFRNRQSCDADNTYMDNPSGLTYISFLATRVVKLIEEDWVPCLETSLEGLSWELTILPFIFSWFAGILRLPYGGEVNIATRE